MITLDGTPLHCIKCGSVDMAAVGREFDADREGGYPALDFIRCGCGYCMKLDTLVTSQHTAPKARKARRTDPAPSQAAAKLDFGNQAGLVLEYLTRLGDTDAGAIAKAMQADGIDVQRSVVARRLNDLEQSGAACRTGTHMTDTRRQVTTWRATQHRRSAA